MANSEETPEQSQEQLPVPDEEQVSVITDGLVNGIGEYKGLKEIKSLTPPASPADITQELIDRPMMLAATAIAAAIAAHVKDRVEDKVPETIAEALAKCTVEVTDANGQVLTGKIIYKPEETPEA